MRRLELWSCGGGRQSVLMLGLIKSGALPRPDVACMVDTNRERSSTWAYVEKVIRPELKALDIPFTVIDRSQYATVDLWSGEDGQSLVIPAFTTKNGGNGGKLPEFCSVEWKQRVAMRWAVSRFDEYWPMLIVPTRIPWKSRGVNCWLGITTEEKHRRRAPKSQWWQATFPLLDVCPSHVSKVYELCERFGWPEPPRSCCWMCPNMHGKEWRDMRDNWPDDFAKACEIDEQIRTQDPHAFVHSSRVPLAMADLGKPDEAGLFGGGCSSGMCY